MVLYVIRTDVLPDYSHEKLPVAIAVKLDPVVTNQPPEDDLAPMGMKNGTKLVIELPPPAKTVIAVPPVLSLIETAPVVAVAVGTTRIPDNQSPARPRLTDKAVVVEETPKGMKDCPAVIFSEPSLALIVPTVI